MKHSPSPAGTARRSPRYLTSRTSVKLRDRLPLAASVRRAWPAALYRFFESTYSAAAPVALDPHAQRIGDCPDRLLLTQLCPRRVGGVIDHVDQRPLRAALLQPRVKAPVHLHQLPKVLLALAPPTVGSTLPLPTPQPFRQHPASQRSGSTFSLSSDSKCSAASVGPNRSPTSPPYFSVPTETPSAESSAREHDATAVPRCVLQTLGTFLSIPLP